MQEIVSFFFLTSLVWSWRQMRRMPPHILIADMRELAMLANSPDPQSLAAQGELLKNLRRPCRFLRQLTYVEGCVGVAAAVLFGLLGILISCPRDETISITACLVLGLIICASYIVGAEYHTHYHIRRLDQYRFLATCEIFVDHEQERFKNAQAGQ